MLGNGRGPRLAQLCQTLQARERLLARALVAAHDPLPVRVLVEDLEVHPTRVSVLHCDHVDGRWSSLRCLHVRRRKQRLPIVPVVHGKGENGTRREHVGHTLELEAVNACWTGPQSLARLGKHRPQRDGALHAALAAAVHMVEH